MGGEEDTPISAGFFHNCEVRNGGKVACWGGNLFGESNAPGGIFVQVSAGLFHTCGVLSDGSAVCWGEDSAGQSSPPGGIFVHVSVGGSHSCGLHDTGSVECWGDNGEGQADAPGGFFDQVSAGFVHTCAVRPNNRHVKCWGDNSYGQADAPAGTFAQVSAGNRHSCGVRTDGSVECWGDNNAGQAPELTLTPASLPNSKVGATYSQSLSVSADGLLYTPPSPTFSVSTGSLPAGLSLSAGGVLSGSPSSGGVFNFTVLVEDANSFIATRSYTVKVAGPVPDLTGTWKPAPSQTCITGKKAKCTLSGTFTVVNQGGKKVTKAFDVRIYLSTDATVDAGDVLLQTSTLAPLKVGGQKKLSLSKVLAKNTSVVGKRLIAVVDAGDAVKESDETNNVIVSAPVP
ncbi:MAG: putative Ig domain-containing protein [Deltaproteobacteria bacterium]|nr:putative Ig domain-containing protein [Deltaproteobacteria bacterium]